MTRAILTFIISMTAMYGMSQKLLQTVRGSVVDKQSQSPMPFVNLMIQYGSEINGTTTDENGEFKVENIETGRIDISVSFIGYRPIKLSNILLTGSKELLLNLEMDESVVNIKEVEISSESTQGVNNKMALTSARTFSVEESKRYAGSNNDMSRMAMNFAGVKAGNDAVNEIVIRGNSPNGLLWRLEDVDIPNPNHFGDDGATGGPISMLNNNVLSNSDFITGAFPAEYGNALSGVFDLKLRNGNNQKREFLGQIGFNGFEFGAEGPISKEKGSSYLVNYRYSTLEVIKALGADFGTGSAVPQYEDLSFKLRFPTKKAGVFNVFGLGGKNYIALLDSDRDTNLVKQEDLYGADYEQDVRSKNSTGIIGISNTLLIGKNAYSKFTLSASQITNEVKMDSLSSINRVPIAFYNKDFDRKTISWSWFINKKINSKNNFRAGIRGDRKSFTLLDSTYNANSNGFNTLRDYTGSTWLIQPYFQWQHNFAEYLTGNLGLHYQTADIGKGQIPEPRAGLHWSLTPLTHINIGYGLHSQMPPIKYTKMVFQDGLGGQFTPNEFLEPTRSHHVILGLEQSITEFINAKIEIYYQYIFNAIVEQNASSFSLLNQGSFTMYEPDALFNGGTGNNRGLELTVERSLNKGFYFLTTASLFDSKYRGSDNIERNTVFNSNYVFNVLCGKEFDLSSNSKNHKKFLTIDVKFNQAGGQRYSPLNLELSRKYNTTVFDDQQANSLQLNDYVRLDIKTGFRLIQQKVTHYWAIDGLNVTNHKNPLFIKYDLETGNVKTINQMGFFPMILYRITF